MKPEFRKGLGEVEEEDRGEMRMDRVEESKMKDENERL